MKNIRKTLKIVLFVLFVIYAIITLLKQQKVLNNYKIQDKNVNAQIAEATEYQEKLNEKKHNINSNEYIEKIAREKLGMYLPNERVYVDNEN